MGNSELQKLKHVPLSNGTISRRITELYDNILLQVVVSKIQNIMFNFFAIQIDKMTDVANLYQLRVFVRHVVLQNTQHQNNCKVLQRCLVAVSVFRPW